MDKNSRQIPNSTESQRRLQAKRERRRVKRQAMRPKRSIAPSPTRRTAATAGSAILDYYADKAGITRPYIHARSDGRVVAPSVFSFTENPEATLRTIADLVAAALNPSIEEISIDHKSCEAIGLGAQAVASVLAEQAYEHCNKTLGGLLPEDEDQRKIVLSVGMPHILGVSASQPDFRVFKLFRGKKPRVAKAHSSLADEATTKLVKYLDDCLKQFSHSLTFEGRKKCSDLVGEVIANAQEHSGRREWWIAAYLQYDHLSRLGDCRLTIFNLGDSIADSLRSLPHTSKLRKQIVARVRRQHRSWLVRGPPRDALWTLHAMQGRVSRRNDGSEVIGDSGQGTVEMIETFQYLSGDENAAMCILSGRTRLTFDGTYKMQPAASGRRTIAFNEANRLAEAPDKRYVKFLDRGFPGTVLSLQFVLQEELLRSAAR